MPSPFPGMNPYLDRPEDWADFHDRMVTYLGTAMEDRLPDSFRTRINENVYIHERSAEERLLIGRPDVYFTQTRPSRGGAAAATMNAPAVAGVPHGIEIEEINFLEIFDKKNKHVVTVIELLSPSNKYGRDAEVYRQKVFQYLRSDVHFVEIDLLRAGTRTGWENLTPSDYSVIVSRASERPRVGHWPIALRDRLPVIPVPLTVEHADLAIDLQQVLHEVYDAARYGKYIYDSPPDPPLSDADSAWAETILMAREH